MKIIGKFKCRGCGCVQNGISEADATAQLETINRHLANISDRERNHWYGSTILTIDSYKRCFYCGAPNEQFEAVSGRNVQAMTNRLIVAQKNVPSK